MKCSCGRKWNQTDWHYGRCAECMKPLTFEQWMYLKEKFR